MKRFLEYVTAFDPDFPMRIEGAAPAQIAELERLTGKELPQSYRAFLATLGNKDGGLDLAFDGTTHIDDVIAYYREEVASGEWPLPPDSILIGHGMFPSIALDCRAPGEPPVRFVNGPEYAQLYAGSLDALLFNTVFCKYALSRFKWRVHCSGSFNRVGRRDFTSLMPNLVRRCGLEPLWFSDGVNCCAEKSDLVVCLTQYEGQGPAAQVAGDRWFDVARIGLTLAHALGLGIGDLEGLFRRSKHALP